MKFSIFIVDRIKIILIFSISMLLFSGFLKAIEVNTNEIILLLISAILIFCVYWIVEYISIKKRFEKLENTMDKLPNKCLIAEIMDKPNTLEEKQYYNILKRSNKAMLEQINEVRQEQKEYKEYIESWIHEIKMPITSAKLLCENHKIDVTRKILIQLENINNYVEQTLYYARSENVENDYIVREIKLENIVRNVINSHKQLLIQNNVQVEVLMGDVIAYTDEKWMEFILNQIIMNAINYKKEKNAMIQIIAEDKKENATLIIKDNGIGIKNSELGRIFEKGFTGANGRKDKKSTGIGLYICKRLCLRLGIQIEAESEIGKYTQVKLILPKGKLVKM